MKTNTEKVKSKALSITLHRPDDVVVKPALYGTASYYADRFTGRKMANGDHYNPESFTAACNVLPIGTLVKVTNLINNRSAIVKITDRLHVRMNRIVDLSKVAAKKLGYINDGLTKVRVRVISKN